MQKEPTEISQFFIPIPDSVVLLSTRQGKFSDAPLFHKRHELFARVKDGFIRLSPNSGMTSQPGTTWHEIKLDLGTYQTEKGKLVWSPKITSKQAA